MTSAGAEAVELAASTGLLLDPWQRHVLDVALGEGPDGRWVAKDVGLLVSRQSGKGGVLEARELAGLFLFGERLIIHSAHLFETSMDHFIRMLERIESNPDLDRRVKRVSRSHGDEGIYLKTGQRLKFKTRTKGGGRGLSGDVVVLDEAMELPTAAMSALRPVMRARPNPQLWMVGSAVDQSIHQHGVEFARMRHRAREGSDDTLAWMEWTADEVAYRKDPDAVCDDPKQWAAATPALGIRIEVDTIAGERRKMDRRGFATELLSVGDWPKVVEDDEADRFQACWPDRARADGRTDKSSPLVFAIDCDPRRDYSTIAVAGWAEDGSPHVELTGLKGNRDRVDRNAGTGWVVDRVMELVAAHDPAAVVVDEKSPLASLITMFDRAGLKQSSREGPSGDNRLVVTSTRQLVHACGRMFDATVEGTLQHRGQRVLDDAVSVATRRDMAGGWAWSPTAAGDIAPLMAATLALWGLQEFGSERPSAEPFFFLT